MNFRAVLMQLVLIVHTRAPEENLHVKTRDHPEEILEFTSPQGGHSRYIRGSSKDAPRRRDFPPPPPHRLPEDILVQATNPPARSPDTSRLGPQVSIFTEPSPTAVLPLLSNPPASA